MSVRHARLRWLVAPVAAAMVASLAPTGGLLETATASEEQLEVIVRSTRADLVSGGDALVEIRPADTAHHGVRIELNGHDVTSAFAMRPNGRYMGLVTGLDAGPNELSAVATGGGARISVTNHSRQGPLFAGPQAMPFLCRTEEFGLGPASGESCEADTRYDYFYKSAVTSRFETYDPTSPPPDALIAMTTTDQGKQVRYIVRRERGVINRGIYDIAVLFQPGDQWLPWQPQDAWNSKLHWIFRGSCDPWHRQNGTVDVLNHPEESPLLDVPLARGFAVATSALNNCNDLLAAETLTMVKEHFIETYGPVRYTTSIGCSGGSAMQHLVANNYPGLVDGIMPTCSIPDVWSLISREEVDCPVLERYFTQTSPQLWLDPSQRAAVTGMSADVACVEWFVADSKGGGGWFFNPSDGCTVGNIEVHQSEPEWVYHPDKNPDGVRCTVQDWQQAVFGQRPASVWGDVEQLIGRGFANWVYDNVGVQYGLLALLRGQITPAQFVDLNVNIGGRDIDHGWTPDRSEATTEGLRNLYTSGRVNDAGRLDRVPIMDIRAFLADVEGHRSVHGQMTRARLIKANGHAGNQVMWVNPNVIVLDPEMVKQAFLTLDEWLAGIDSDTSHDPLETKVLRHKPPQAKDSCWMAGQPDACGSNVPYTSNPNMQAGGPLTGDIFKCHLKPLDWGHYGSVELPEEQKQRLRAAFPDGVCDWTKPGVEQHAPREVWQTFMTGTGGVPLGPAPRSVPISGH